MEHDSRIESSLNKALKNAVKHKLIVDEPNKVVCIAVIAQTWTKVLQLFRFSFRIDEATPTLLLCDDLLIDEYTEDEREKLDTDFEKACEGYVRCYSCGELVKYDDVTKFAPSYIACKKPECLARGRAVEQDFFSYPLD